MQLLLLSMRLLCYILRGRVLKKFQQWPTYNWQISFHSSVSFFSGGIPECVRIGWFQLVVVQNDLYGQWNRQIWDCDKECCSWKSRHGEYTVWDLIRRKVQSRAKGMKDFNNSAFKGRYRKGSQKGQNNWNKLKHEISYHTYLIN